MINSFGVNYNNVYWSSIAPKMYRKYYEYDDYWFEKDNYTWKVDSHYGIFHVYENSEGDLVVAVSPEDMPEFIGHMNDALENNGYESAEYDVFEPIWTNGLDYLNISTIGALSEAPAFASLAYLPDWIAKVRQQAHKYPNWMHPDYAAIDWKHSKLWTAINYYQIESPLDQIKERGYAVFNLAKE